MLINGAASCYYQQAAIELVLKTAARQDILPDLST